MSKTFGRSSAKVGALLFVTALMGLLVTPAAKAGGPISFRGAASHSTDSNSETLTIAKPTGTVEGDFMLAQVTFEGGDHLAVTPPSEWQLEIRTDKAGGLGQAIYWKFAGDSEPADYTWTFDDDKKLSGGISSYDEVDPSDPVVASAGAASNTDTLAAPNIESASGDFLVSLFGTKQDTTLSQPTGMTARYFVGTNPTVSGFDQADPGTNEARSSTAGDNKDWVAHSVILAESLVPGPDTDGDTVEDDDDNCVDTPNTDQTDTDNDGDGDECDDDDDDDGQSDADETACGSDPLDENDTSPDTDNDGVPDCLDDDDDDDGQSDADETACGSDPLDENDTSPDTDNDGVPDCLDDDDDDDGQSDADETACGSDPLDENDTSPDTDNDGVPDCLDDDDDDDGQSDADETACGSDPLDENDTSLDTDEDGVPNCLDDDDDDDGFDDEEEGATSPGNTQGSDPLDDNSTPEVCDDELDNDGNEGVDEGCPDVPDKVFVDSDVTMTGVGTPFSGDVESPRKRCKKNRQVDVRRRVAGPDTNLGSAKSNKDFEWKKWVGKNLKGGFYAKMDRKRYETSEGTEVVCKANRSPLIQLS